MRLNGWQRVWVVATVLWALAVSVGAWSQWPQGPEEFVSVFPLTTPLTYYDAVAHLERRSAWLDEPGPMPTPTYDAPGWFAQNAPQVQRVEIALIGNVVFPRMSRDQADTAAKELAAEHEQLLSKINQQLRERFSTRRLTVMKISAAVWLSFPLALYIFGWSLGWVYRVFRTS